MVIFSGMLLFMVRLWMIQSIDTEIMDHSDLLWRKLYKYQTSFDSLSSKRDIQFLLNSESSSRRYFTWIVNTDSQIVAVSNNVHQINTSLTKKLPVRVLTDKPQFTSINDLGFTHRCVAYPILVTPDSTTVFSFENHAYPVMGWVITASSSVPVTDLISSLTRLLIGMVILCMIIATAFALVLSDFALRPLSEIVDTAKTITAAHLSTRIPSSGNQDEVGQLVLTLNHLFDRLEASFEQMGQFTADASHELLTPLTIIKGELDLALTRDRETEYYKTSLNNALVQTNQLILVTQTLLKLSRSEIEAENQGLEYIDLKILVDSLFRQLNFLAGQKRMVLEEKLENPLPLIQTSENLLHTLLFNLIENAIKYSPPGKKVTIRSRVHPTSGKFTLDVVDYGLGIADEEKKNIFRRFYRVEKSRAKITGGSGLGLSLVSKICELLNLEIEVTNNNPMGSVFSVSFPADSVFY